MLILASFEYQFLGIPKKRFNNFFSGSTTFKARAAELKMKQLPGTLAEANYLFILAPPAEVFYFYNAFHCKKNWQNFNIQ